MFIKTIKVNKKSRHQCSLVSIYYVKKLLLLTYLLTYLLITYQIWLSISITIFGK